MCFCLLAKIEIQVKALPFFFTAVVFFFFPTIILVEGHFSYFLPQTFLKLDWSEKRSKSERVKALFLSQSFLISSAVFIFYRFCAQFYTQRRRNDMKQQIKWTTQWGKTLEKYVNFHSGTRSKITHIGLTRRHLNFCQLNFRYLNS